ncbi:hypothetical protein, partial [Pseudomonas sp. GW123-5C08]|uniref:hypothetical protein n=1 Tax=Pseudomonas sp. GW123-5C08 TaxID=2070587 RepID=UPI001304A783
FYPELFNTASVFPTPVTDRCIAIVVDDATTASIALAARLANSLREAGTVLHLVTFAGHLSGNTNDLDAFAEFVSLPLASLRT